MGERAEAQGKKVTQRSTKNRGFFFFLPQVLGEEKGRNEPVPDTTRAPAVKGEKKVCILFMTGFVEKKKGKSHGPPSSKVLKEGANAERSFARRTFQERGKRRRPMRKKTLLPKKGALFPDDLLMGGESVSPMSGRLWGEIHSPGEREGPPNPPGYLREKRGQTEGKMGRKKIFLLLKEGRP